MSDTLNRLELTLCASCAGVFYMDETRIIERKPNQTIKQPCDICTRCGYEYVIEVKDEN